MQTPKARNSSSEVPQKISPRAVSLEASQKISPRAVSSVVPQKVSPRAARQLKTTASESDSAASSNQASKTPKDKSSKVIERRSPRSPVTEKKRPSKVAELEAQISELQDDLKKVKDQLYLSESWKNQSQQEAEELRKQLLLTSSKLNESYRELLEGSAPEEAQAIELRRISEECSQAWQFELEDIQEQHAFKSAELASALNEVKKLKIQLEQVTDSEAAQSQHTVLVHAELQGLKENLAETLLLVDDMKSQLRDCRESEAEAQALVAETMLQLEMAKKTIETLRFDGAKAMEAYNAVALELDHSRGSVDLLEGLVNKLKVDTSDAGCHDFQNPAGDQKFGCEIRENEKIEKLTEVELSSTNLEVEQLKSALETAEIRIHEEQIQSIVQIRNAYDLVDQIKSASSLREAELQSKLKKLEADIEELKANLMDKETELQGICEENEDLNMRLENSLSRQKECEPEKELKKLKEHVKNLKANLMDKELEFQNIMEENELLRLEIKKKDINQGKVNDGVVAELEAARAAEQEALMKFGYMKEEAEKSSRRAARVGEQLEAAQTANSEMEAELRRLKVQSEQWRKAAEAAVAMLSTGNNGKLVDRTASLDSYYSPITGSSPNSEDMDDNFLKKKNGNMLKRIGVLWKKPQK